MKHEDQKWTMFYTLQLQFLAYGGFWNLVNNLYHMAEEDLTILEPKIRILMDKLSHQITEEDFETIATELALRLSGIK